MPEAYCGPPLQPHTLLVAWNPDVAALALCLALAVAHRYRGEGEGRWPLALAVAVLLLLFVSPLCALTVALFSARVAHHALLVAVAAPLLALAFPARARAALPVPLAWLAGLHAAALWLWHLPLAYGWGIAAPLPYWTMQASLLASAFLLWRGILSPRAPAGSALLAIFATVLQMGMLGALLTFAQRPLYAPHLTTTLPFGLSPLEDQQLAGLIMWVPAALPWLAAALWTLSALPGGSGHGRAPSVGRP